MKFEVGKSYKTRGGWRAEVDFVYHESRAVSAVHYLGEKRLGRRDHNGDNGCADKDYTERPYPEGWDHPSDLTQEEWKE